MTVENHVERGEPRRGDEEGRPAPDNGEDAVLDWTGLLDSWDGDREFVVELLTTFMEQLTSQRESLAGAVAGATMDTLASAAHSLKGSCLAIMAKPVADLAFILETMGRNGDAADAPTVWQQLDGQLTRLTVEIERVREKG